MMALKNYQPFNVGGPYRRKLRVIEIVASLIGHIAIGSILAYAVFGAAGWL
ncbi:MAG: hypothetical protein ACR2K1_08490 [Saprospiraceae bacterium]